MSSLLAKARIAAEMAGIAICLILLWAVSRPQHPTVVNSPLLAQAAPEVVNTPKVAIVPARVMAYAPAVKNKVILPADVAHDPDVAVLESSKLQGDDHPQTVTTVLNTRTGIAETYVTTDPYPWVSTERHGSIGFGYGLIPGMTLGFALNAHEDLLQVKAIHFGVDGSLYSNGALAAVLGASYHW